MQPSRKWAPWNWALVVVAVVAVAGAVAWSFRAQILLEFAARQSRIVVAPNQPIEWQSGADPEGRAPDERPPNIVVILADDLGWNDLSFGGGGIAGGAVPTPNIDSIAPDGVNFRNGYAANATCAPSRAAIMTGRYGTRFGFEFTPTPAGMMQIVPRLRPREPKRLRDSVIHDAESIPYEEMGLPPSEITLAELLGEAGYHTAHVGKWHLGRTGGMAAHEQGFDESLLMLSGLYLPEDHPEVVNSRQEFDPRTRRSRRCATTTRPNPTSRTVGCASTVRWCARLTAASGGCSRRCANRAWRRTPWCSSPPTTAAPATLVSPR